MTEQVLAKVHQHRRVLDALTAANIRHVLWRGSPGSGDDLDLLVHPADTGRAGQVLAGLGLRSAPSEHHWPHRLYVGRHEGVDVVVDVLDRPMIRTALLGGPNMAARLVEGAVTGPDGVRRLAPAEAAWVQIIHVVLRGAPTVAELAGATVPTGVNLSDTAELSGAAELSDVAVLARAVDRVLGAGTAAGVRSGLASRSAGATAPLQRLDGHPWPRADRARRALARWRGRVPGAAGTPAGVRVVLLGPDGAGKSTLSAGLRQALPLPVHEIYMGVFRMDGWQQITRLVPGLGLASRLSRLRWRAGKAGYFCRRGHVVVFDRYTYDAGLRPGKRGLRARMSYFFLERALPDPDVVLVLDCPGEVMFARKREHDVQTLEERRGWYLAMAEDLPNAVVIDATLAPDRVLQEALTAVWRALQPS